VTFFLSEAPAGANAALPLVVYVQGSGCGSVFASADGRITPTQGHITVAEAFASRARVLVVEKPGVTYLEQPPNCSALSAFAREHTLERWSVAIETALMAARAVPGVEARHVLVIGHSEGGLVACRVAHDLPDVVTAVASLAGGGPTQLFDLIELARRGTLLASVSSDPDARAAYVVDQWTAIAQDPTSADKTFLGFAYRRWATFLSSSPWTELASGGQRIYLAQGMADDAVDLRSADVLYAQLLAAGRTVTYDRVPRADHSFTAPGTADGWRTLMDRIAGWFVR
jgi:pimeloyl-ACP methyl ester carboxylesterase